MTKVITREQAKIEIINMRYSGGKTRIAKQLCSFLDTQMQEDQPFVDLFAGSCNIVANITKTKMRYANDINRDIMTTMHAASEGFEFPTVVTEEEYKHMRQYGDASDPLYGFMAYGCSFAGRRWQGYARGGGQNYAAESARNLSKKGKLLQGVVFSVGSYRDFIMSDNAIVYCDIPYSNRKGYEGKAASFNHNAFYDWVAQQNCEIFISEYQGGFNPLGLDIVWSKDSKQGIASADGTRKTTTEVLFRKPKV